MRSLLVILLVVTASRSFASTILDQEHDSYNWNYYLDYPGDYMAQTFTVRNSGKLAEVGVEVVLTGYSNYKPPVDDLHIKVVRTDSSGAPAVDQVLASRSFAWTELKHYNTGDSLLRFDVSPWNIPVSVGEVLAIVLSSKQTADNYESFNARFDYLWLGGTGNPHSGGDFYLYSPKQFGPAPHKWTTMVNAPSPPPPNTLVNMNFQILVEEVPEPGSLALAACSIGVGSAGWLRRRRRD